MSVPDAGQPSLPGSAGVVAGRIGVVGACLARPVRAELRVEALPENHHLIEDRLPVGRGRVRRCGMSGLGEPGHHQIGDEGTQVETDRPQHRELAVDDARVVLGHHHRSGVQVAMNQCLRVGQVVRAVAGDRRAQRQVVAQRRRPVVEPRHGPAVAWRFGVGIDEDQIDRDALQCDIACEQSLVFALALERIGEIGGVKPDGRHVIGHRRRGMRIVAAANQARAQHDVGLQPLHHDQVQLGIEVQPARRQRTDDRFDAAHVGVFEIGTFDRQRPARPGHAQPRQRLLDTDAAARPFHQVDRIDVAIGDIAHLPRAGVAAEQLREVRPQREQRRDLVGAERAVARRCRIGHGSPASGGDCLRRG